MDLNTITEVVRPANDAELSDLSAQWERGTAWLAGGTWLFSEPQPSLSKLIDLGKLNWSELESSDDGLRIGATCKIADLYAVQTPEAWKSGQLIQICCRALLASFKIWNEATVGGNVCMALPAGAMITLGTALNATCTLWSRGGASRTLPLADFVLGTTKNALGDGELLRETFIPATALRRPFAFRRLANAEHGRSMVFLVGLPDEDGGLRLTVTAATDRPVVLQFPTIPTPEEIDSALDQHIDDALYVADCYRSAAYRKHMTYYFARQICEELATAPTRPR